MTGDSLTALLRAIPLPSLLVGRGERIIAANNLALELLGPGITGRHFITAIRQPAVLDAVEASLGDKQTRETRMLTTRGGQDHNFDVTCTYVETSFGSGVLTCFEDITHVEKAEKMRRDFVANVSHELRTPLTALLGFIETLQGPARNDPDAQQRFLHIMANEAGRMERLVKDLLSLSRVESEERMRPAERVEMGALVRSVRSTLAPLATEAAIDLRILGDDQPLHVQGDADQLRQVLTNLVENGIKYGGSGGEVAITLEAQAMARQLKGPAVILTVADKGQGIDEVHLPRLTERFYRVDSHRSREMGGTGLGLAIVKHIVNRHRGRLRIDSEAGQGTRITVILPAS
ncbi:sensor histidine kinase [Pseudooceanicola aestuarii]|uniref:sensor histidine kinase n=1 Tax=Pseudooceanicola aestuarii TaxID=2697319 RepID=UPI0013CFD9CA|nr:ATP-binding protein [Pseudooceanicola aestuarii]